MARFDPNVRNAAAALWLLPSLVLDQLVDTVFQLPRALRTPHQVEQRLELGAQVFNARPLAPPPVACMSNPPQDHP
jgi:hypothetical protein